MAKIVIVEDDDATRAGYRELLNLAGHEVIATSTYQKVGMPSRSRALTW
jgi:DNA-binding NtrC family response regulator